MWSVDAGAGCTAASSAVRYRTSSNGISWSSPVDVNIAQPGRVIWHLEVSYIPSKNEYWMIYPAYPSGSTCGSTDLYFAKSTDKINWITYNDPIIKRDAAWDSAEIYRSTFLYNDSTDMLGVWYSASDGSTWHTGYTERQYSYFADGLRWSRSGDTGSSVINPRDGMYGLRQAGGLISPVHKLSQGSGSYSYNIWYKDELSTVSDYLAVLNLTYGATFSNIGVFTSVSNANYARAIGGSYTDTGIARTAGWHRLEIQVNSSGAYFFVDGRNAGSTASVTSSTSVTPGINGFSNGIAYYDDFYIRKYSFPEPAYIFREERLSSGSPPPISITNYSPEPAVTDYAGTSRSFNLILNQTVNVTWYLNGSEVQINESTTDAAYTNTSAAIGTWNVSAVATNNNGTVMQTWEWVVTAPPMPGILGYSPESHVNDMAGAVRSFNLTLNETVNVRLKLLT